MPTKEKVILDFEYFIQSAIKKELPWKSLAYFLTDLSTTLDKSKQVIRVLVQELEIWVLKVESEKNKVENYSKEDDNHEIEIPGIDITEDHEQIHTAENMSYSHTTLDFEIESKEHEITEDFLSSIEIEDEIQVLEETKKSMDERLSLDFNNQKESAEYENHLNEINDHDSTKEVMNQSVNVIGNEWYTFITNDKTLIVPKVIENEGIKRPFVLSSTEEPKENERIHTREKKNECQTCEKSFRKPNELKIHERVHTGEVPFECKLCKKRFKSKTDLGRHEKVHTGEMPYECKTCNKRFRTVSNLKTHERIHSGEVPFECQTCKKRFKRSSHLKRHEISHTGEIPFRCKTCNKRFTRMETLKIHARIHTGEFPYECKTCSKRFKSNSELRIHGRIHTRELPYECKTCSWRFNHLSTLKIHVRTHTGEMPYECKICKRRFKQISPLKIHERIHTREVEKYHMSVKHAV